jgi:hypothetical protein
MQKYKVLEDKVSYKKDLKYASAGDIVTCICWHGDVCIVQNVKGNRFSIHKDKLSLL